MEDFTDLLMKITEVHTEGSKGEEAFEIFNMAAFLAPKDIRIGVFSPHISDRSQLKAAISLLRRLSFVQCPKENAFFVPEDIGSKLRRYLDCMDAISSLNVKEDILKRAITILNRDSGKRLSDYPHWVSIYTHAKGYPRVLEELGELPAVAVMGMMKDGKFREAVEFGKECDEYLTKILGEDNRIVLNLECTLGLALIEEREEAVKLLSSAYYRSCRFGHDDEVDNVMKALATVLFRDPLAEERNEKRLRSIIFPGSSVSETNSSSELMKWVEYAVMLNEFDLTAQALLILDDVIKRRTALFGQNDVLIFSAIETRALILGASSDKDLEQEAVKVLERVYEKKRNMFGPSDIKTLLAKGLIGQVLFQKGDLEEAMTMHEDVVSNIKQIDCNWIGLYARGMEEMIEICVMKEDFVKALQLSSDLHDQLASVYGDMHPKCFQWRKRRSDWFLKLNQPEKALEVLKRLSEDYEYEMDEEELESVSAEMRKIEHIRSFDDAPPLHSFAKDGNLEMVLSLIEKSGEDVESKDSNDRTPLHYAAAFGRVEVARALLGKGSKTPSKALEGMTALLGTVRSFFDAVKANDCEAILGIASAEPCVLRARDDQGCSPLHWAALRGHSGVLRLLLELGSDPAAVSDKGNSPLHIAASKGHSTVTDILLRSLGPSALDGRTTGGNTPLHAAAGKGHRESVRSLLLHGAVWDSRNAAGKTPCEVSEDVGCRDLLGLVEGLFLDVGVGDVAGVCEKLRDSAPDDVLAVSGARNGDRRTLLQEAVERKNLVVAMKLVKLFDYSS